MLAVVELASGRVVTVFLFGLGLVLMCLTLAIPIIAVSGRILKRRPKRHRLRGCRVRCAVVVAVGGATIGSEQRRGGRDARNHGLERATGVQQHAREARNDGRRVERGALAKAKNTTCTAIVVLVVNVVVLLLVLVVSVREH